MASVKQNLIDWLRDAHGMEQHALVLMEKQEQRLKHYPDLLTQIRKHKEETAWQSSQIDKCLKILGADPSAAKKMLGRMTAYVEAMGAMMASDEVVKNTVANIAFEHFESAVYTVLLTTAAEAGEMEVAEICRDILEQEMDMAQWLEDHLDDTTNAFLARDQKGVEAKV